MQHHNKTRTPPPKLQEGHVAFKVVCHKSLVSGLIGTSGSIISKIRRQTSSHIRCEQLIEGADHCIIHVSGSDRPEIKLTLNDVEQAVSAAQEGVIKVLERMWELERGDLENHRGSEGYCGLLSDSAQVGAVMGKGGNHITRMRRYSGANIVILPPPFCASKHEELIQITGDKLAVKKAVIAVTYCLQECPPLTKQPTASRLVDLFPHLSSLLPHLTPVDVDSKHNAREVCFRLLCSNTAAGSIIGKRGSIVRALQDITGASILFDSPTTVTSVRIVTVSALEDVETEYSLAQNAVVFVFARSVEHEIQSGHSGLSEVSNVTAQLLVESGAAFCLSGNGERIDQEIARVSGAEIRVLEEERVLESWQSEVVVQMSGEYRNVQNALFLVTSRIRNLLSNDVANKVRKRVDSDREIHLARGIDRLRLSDRKIESLSVSHLPQKLGTDYTPNNNDNGSLANVVRATELERSLHFLLPREVLDQVSSRNSNGKVKANASSGLYLQFGPSSPKSSVGTASTHGHQADLSSRINHCAAGMQPLKDAGREDITANQGTEKKSTTRERSGKQERTRRALVANTTLELIVSDDLIHAIYGENGSNLENLRKISGAKIEVQDPTTGKSDGTVVISGPPDQTRLAESLIRAFI